MDLLGKTLGNYRIDRLLGEGGMGAVYQAYDLSLQRDVAIKLIHEHFARLPSFRERFIQEARLMASLNHSGIVKVYTLNTDGNMFYLPMEFIAGGDLRQLLDKMLASGQWLPLHEAIRLVEQLCQTLEYAHQHKVLHRDIKPANLMIKREPSKGLPFRLVLTDLGLARILEGKGLTQEGTTVGTPAYMSPEQASGRETDPRSDVYSLGILLYELVVGRLPFPIRSITEAVRYHTQEPPPPPRSIRPSVPEAVEQVILKALAKDPNQRYASAAELGTVLAKVMAGLETAPNAAGTPGISLSTMYDRSIVSPTRPVSPNPTMLAGNSIAARGASVFDGKSISPSSMSRIQVVHKEHTAEVFPLPLGTVSIGRGSGNDIPLSDPKASHRHAQITWDGQEYKVLDLNSTNGTYMGNSKLLAGLAEVWRPNQHLRIGDTWLRLILATEALPSASGYASKVVNTSMYASSSAGVVAVAINPQQLAMEAGGSATVTISLINQSPQVDHFSVSLTGVPGHWILNLPSQVELMSGAPREIVFTLHVPRAPQSRAGRQQLTLKATSQRNPNQFAEAKLALTIAAYSQFKAELRPMRLRAGQTGHLTISNQGNAQETFAITFADDFQDLSFQPPQQQARVKEGETATLDYRAQPRRTRWVGGEQSHTFNAQVSLPQREPQTLRADLLSRGLLPAWVPLTIIPLCLLFAGVLAALLGNIPGAKPTEPSGPNVTLTPSATPEPGAPIVEEWCVYPKDQPPPDFTNCPVQVKAMPGQILNIRWRVSNASELSIDPIGGQPSSGEISYEVTATTTQISLRANNLEDKQSQKATQIIVISASATVAATSTSVSNPLLTGTAFPTSTPHPSTPTLIPPATFTPSLTSPPPTRTMTPSLTPSRTPTPSVTAFVLEPCFQCLSVVAPFPTFFTSP